MDARIFLQICSANPDLFIRLIPETDDVKDIAKLCLVSTSFRDFLFSTLPGRHAWLRTGSLQTGYDGFKVIDVRVSDFQYQLKLLVSPWLSKMDPLLFSIPECDWADEKDIRLINNSRLLFRARNNGEGDGDEESCVFSFSSMPCKSEEEFNKTLTTLPEDFPEVDAPDVDDAIVEQMSREQIIPDYFDSSTMLYRHIHKTAFAVLESKNNSMCGNVYFMSTRNPQKLKMLRHMVVHFMDSFIDNDLCSAPQKIWLMTTDCIFYMGPQVGELRKEKLECDKTDGRIGRLTPALWMVSEEGDAAGAIKFMKETLNNLHINTPSLLCGRTIIYYAIFGNKPEALRLLIAAGANVNHLDDAKVSPLMLAASLLNVECVRVLCENGANPRIHGKDQKTALLFTGEKGSSDDIIRVMGLLFSAGAKPNEADDRNETVLFKPCGFKDPKILRFLLGKGADPKHLDNNGNTLLHACVGKKTHEGMVVILVKELGIDINAQNNMGTTALSMHIFSLSLKDVEFWVNELKADTTIKDIAGISAHRRYTSNPCYVINHQQYHKNYAEISAILKEK